MSLNDPLGLLKKKKKKRKAEYFEPRWKSSIEEKELEFIMEAASIQFHRNAKYILKFTLVESFTDKYEGVLAKQNDEEYTEKRELQTDVIVPVEVGTRQPFSNRISFVLPKGYCKNDGHHDVHLRIEAWEATVKEKGPPKLTKLVGQSVYPIYPRPKHTAINLNPKHGRPMLRENLVLPFLRTPNTDQRVMHCGDVAFSVIIKDRSGTSGWQSSVPTIRVSSASVTVDEDLTERTGRAVTTSHLPSNVSPVSSKTQQHSYLKSKSGKQQYVVTPEPLQTTISEASRSKTQQYPNIIQTATSEKPPYFTTKNQNNSFSAQHPKVPAINLIQKGAAYLDYDDESEDELLQIGEVVTGKPRKREEYVSLHDIKYLNPDAFGKAIGDGNSLLSQLSHVSHPGTEKIDVIVHSACSLPERSSDNNLPRPFVAVSSTMGFLHNEIQSFTHVSKTGGGGPYGTWDELCTVEFDGVTVQNEAIVLAVVDKETLQIMACYSIPVTFLQPYQEYHLELLLPKRHGVKTRVYISLMRKLPEIPHEHMGPAFGIEVLVRQLDFPLAIDPGPLVCVGRVIPDYSQILPINRRQHSLFGVAPRRITFPLPKPSAFIESEKVSIGNPQVTLPADRSTQPRWNFPFLFATPRDKATLFTPGTALLLELYQASTQTKDDGWFLTNPIGYAIVPLDNKMYESISTSTTSLGVSMAGIPIIGNTLFANQGKTPTMSIALRLLSPHAVDTLATQAETTIESLPRLDIHPFIHELKLNCKSMNFLYSSPCPVSSNKRTSVPPQGYVHQQAQPLIEKPAGPAGTMHLVSKQKLVPVPTGVEDVLEEYHIKMLAERLPHHPLSLNLNEGELPPADAMQSVLPEYRYILEGGGRRKDSMPPMQMKRDSHPHVLRQLGDDPSGLVPQGHIERQRIMVGGADSPTLGMAGMIPVNADAMAVAELDQYRRAVRRMGEDILALRRELVDKAQENSRLANQLAHYDDLTKTVVSTQVIEGLSKAELADRYVASRQQLITSEEQLQQYKQRIQKLHNEIIKKNDREVEGAHIRQAHAAQQTIIQRMQDKCARYDKLVETIRHQELVIERMERILTTRLKAIPSANDIDINNVQREAYDSVVEENTQLRRQIEELRIINEATGQAQSEVDVERLHLMQAMDRMEARIQALEKELEDRSRDWGRERAELVIKLNEQHRGFSPTKQQSSPPRVHDYSPTRGSPAASPPRGNVMRFTVAESAGATSTAFPALPNRNTSPVGVGRTLLGRTRVG